MPVFSRMKDNVLVLTVDGDYTAAELTRVGDAALGSAPSGPPLPVVLDVSGAAGLETRSAEALVEEARALGNHAARIGGLAVVVASRFGERFHSDSAFARALGVETRACASHREAMDWLASRRER